VSSFTPTPFAVSLLDAMRAGGSPVFPDWRDGIYPPLREAAEVAASSIRLHKAVRARNSSMVFAFNLLLPFKEASSLRLPPPLDDVVWERLELEWTPPGALLCEIAGDVPEPDEPATAIDGVLWGRRGDAAVVVLVEVKLTEGGFTHCNGKDSRGNRDRAPCEDVAVLLDSPQRCYLRRPYRATRERRYWPIFEAAHGSLRGAFPGVRDGGCPFAGDGQQLMRQHALALAMEQEGLADQAFVLVLHHDDNPDVPEHFEQYWAITATPGRLLRLAASRLLESDPTGGDWAAWMRARYLL